MYALASQSSGGSWVLLILVYAVIFAGFWFIFIRPQRKEQKRVQAMISEMELEIPFLQPADFME